MELFIPWHQDETVGLAISGGVDSMVLYHLLHTRYLDRQEKLVLFHVNHGQREASLYEAEYIRDMAMRDGHQFEMVTLDIPASSFNQEVARAERYRFFDRMMKKHGAGVLATAHHLDDQYETVLHSLLSGRHLPGAMGIPDVRQSGSYEIVRPMIGISRRTIEAYCAEHAITFFEDETNSASDYTRNYIRHHIIPPIKASNHLDAKHLLQIKEDMGTIDAMLSEMAEDFLRGQESGLDRSNFNGQRAILKFYILVKWLKQHDATIRRRHAEEIIGIAASDLSNTSFDIGDVRLVIAYDKMTVASGEVPKEDTLAIDCDGTYMFNGYRITAALHPDYYPLTVRTRQTGDRMHVPGTGTKKLSRIFIDKKVPADDRGEMPVILDQNDQIIALGEIYNIMDDKEKDSRLLIEKEFTDEPKK